MDKAVVAGIGAEGWQEQDIGEWKLVEDLGFAQKLKVMGHVWEKAGKRWLVMKGAPESILAMTTSEKRREWQLKLEELLTNGERVLAVGVQELAIGERASLERARLMVQGLIGFADPVKKSVVASIRECQRAGIRVMMITGDNVRTAVAVARQAGLGMEVELGSEMVLEGAQIEMMSGAKLAERLQKVVVVARVMPLHKKKIIAALQRRGEVVAMLGDGINDAVALRQADVGVAMGKTGTSVAQAAAEIILLDDNFRTIVAAVADGRGIYQNLKRSFRYIFIVHVPLAMVSLMTAIWGWPAMFLPAHVILMELVIDPTCSLILERDSGRDRERWMRERPRDKNELLLDGWAMWRSAGRGAVIGAVVLGMFGWWWPSGVERARAMALVTLVSALVMLVFWLERQGEVALGQKLRDGWVVGFAALVMGLVWAVVSIPAWSGVFDLVALEWWEWAVAVGVGWGVVVAGWWMIERW
jgi:Ca2+-transporting ATPase